MAAATRNSRRSARWRAIGLVITLLLGIGLAIRMTTPIAAKPANAPATAFSAGRAMRDIARIGASPHPVGSAEHARVEAYLVARMRSLGLMVSVDQGPIPADGARVLAGWSGADAARPRITNIVGVWPGRDRHAPALMLMAHYDTVWGSPGAADDSGGVATVLEDLRALKADGGVPARDIVVLLTDGEEIGLVGAKQFFGGNPLARRIGLVINHETRGGGGRTAMFETGEGNGPAMRLFARSVPHPLVNSLSVLVYRLMPNSTDLTVALAHEVPGYNLAFTGRPRLYHSPLAVPGAIEPGAIQDMGDQSLALATAVALAPAPPPRGADAAFSDLLGLVTISYPPAWGLALIAAAALMLGGAGWRLARSGTLDDSALRGGIATALFLPALAAPMLIVGNLVSGSAAEANYYDRLAALPRLEWEAALLCAAALLASTIVRRPKRRWRAVAASLSLGALAALLGHAFALVLVALPVAVLTFVLPPLRPSFTASWFGLVVLLLTLGTAVQALAPTAAPLIDWPVLIASAGAAAFAIFSPEFDRPAPIVLIAILFGLALAQALAFAHFVFSGIGAPLPVVAVPFLMIAAMLVRPFLGASQPVAMMSAVAALVLAAIGIALWVRLDPIAASVPLYSLR